ncbi:MAG: dienelactone hydrolase family protein [Thermoproteota archaeon]|nr:dienelactone hydrolase family protein [Thermoproteota archaeon]
MLVKTIVAITLGFTLIGALLVQEAYATMHESSNNTIRHRDLTIDLGNGVQTDAELTLPVLANRSLPAILLIHGIGPLDKDQFIPPDSRDFKQIAEYLSERGFVVLRYDKRAIGANDTIEDPDLWYNQTMDDLISDANKALHTLVDQPEVDKDNVSVLGGSQGSWIATRVAAANPFVKNVLLLSTGAEKLGDIIHTQMVNTTLQYTREILDVNHDGFVSLSEVAATENTPYWTYESLLPSMILVVRNDTTGNYRFVGGLETREINSSSGEEEAIEIDTTLRSFLEQRFQSIFVDTEDRSCPYLGGAGCPPMMRSIAELDNLSVIGNISSSSILIIQGGHDLGQPPAQAFMLEQKLLDLNHPDHTIIVYPGHGHLLTYIGEDSWIEVIGPIPHYILQDIYSWLIDPDRKLSRQSDVSVELSPLA